MREPLEGDRPRPPEPSAALAVVCPDERERPCEERDGLLVGALREHPFRRLLDQRERTIAVGACGSGLAEVEGDLDERRSRLDPVLLFERRGGAPVEPLPPRAAEAAVEGLADECVRERIAGAGAAARLDDELCIDRLLQCVDERVLVELGHRAEDVEGEAAPEHGSMREHALAAFGEASEAPRQHFHDPLGHADLVRRQGRRPAAATLEEHAGLDQMAHHLLDEERVSLRVLEDGAHEPGGRLIAGVRRDELADAPLVEPVEPDALEQPLATQVGEQLRERVLAAELLVPVGADHEQRRFVRRSDDVPQQAECGSIRPLEVVQHEHERGARRRLAQKQRDGLEQQVAVRLPFARFDRLLDGLRGCELRNQPGELPAARAEGDARPVETSAPRVVAKRLDEGLVRDECFLLAGGVEHGAVVVHPERELAQQPRLADPRLAGDQHEPAAAGTRLLPRGPQDVELPLASDER